ncbi:hypothetical protein EYR36_011578 [Pleurotus pulmonarius]|nr:hypothetical protein EYR36_011578 [Pleurotus pulmonarius]
MWSPSAKKQELSHPDGIQVTGLGVQEVAVKTESTNRFIMLPLAAFLTILVLGAFAREPSVLQRQLLPDTSNSSETNSFNVTKCPGYNLHQLKQSEFGFTAQLSLAGPACNAFGRDIVNLTIQVAHESQTRLHVNIFDTDGLQYQVPETIVSRPRGHSPPDSSDLVFNYDPSPFAFWITRRSQPGAIPLFDTRISSLPKAPIAPVIPADNSTALDGFPLVFEDQYLQLTSALPLDANIYGLGEVVASSGFRRDVGAHGGRGTIQTMWARDIADPIDENIYGSHPVYLEHRYNAATKKSHSHGVFLLSAAGADILLLTPPGSAVSLVEYRMIGGVLDFYFFSGPTPQDVVEQYGALVGLPTWQPIWGFGFHLCRWGYRNIDETRQQVLAMKAANIPLEVMWNDIDLYHAVRDFTADPVSFPADDVRAFILELAANHQKYIPIVDAAIPKQVNETDLVSVHPRRMYLLIKPANQKVFITNPDGSEYVGQVWPGYTVFPDWFANNTERWWTDALRNWTASGVEFAGIWLDMNEASSFCDGSCGTNTDISNTSVPFLLPGEPGNPIVDYPECYNSSLFGPSGNMTVDGRSTCIPTVELKRRALGAGSETGINVNEPPYTIHNGFGRLSEHALATNATHADGSVEIDVHNLWGLMEEIATHRALLELHPGQRPFIISRSTFASAGKWTGHWLGDNFSKWQYMHFSIQGILQFQLFQIPFVGADTCGFNGNSDEELCNRWMQLAAFTPFYRNHNILGAIPQEPYRWDSVANASRTAISARYSLLPYWYSLFANSSMAGTPPVRALFFEFPDEPKLFGLDRQFLVGRDILVTPVLTPNATTVEAVLPGQGSVIWRDWWTHEVVNGTDSGDVTLPAPLGHINVHVRDGSAILLHAQPGYTIEETRQGPYSLLISLTRNGDAIGHAYVDDGVSIPPTSNRVLNFLANRAGLAISSKGSFDIKQRLHEVTILGVHTHPQRVTVQGRQTKSWRYIPTTAKLVIDQIDLDLNQEARVLWG